MRSSVTIFQVRAPRENAVESKATEQVRFPVQAKLIHLRSIARSANQSEAAKRHVRSTTDFARGTWSSSKGTAPTARRNSVVWFMWGPATRVLVSEKRMVTETRKEASRTSFRVGWQPVTGCAPSPLGGAVRLVDAAAEGCAEMKMWSWSLRMSRWKMWLIHHPTSTLN